METKPGLTLTRIARWTAGAAGIVFLVWAIVSIVRVGTIFWLFTDLATWVDASLNLDDRVATLIAVLLTAATVPLLPLITSFVLFGKYRFEMLGVAVIAAASIFALLYAFGDDVFFDGRTGKPLRYYLDTPTGVVFSRSPGFDKKFGIGRIPVTPQIIQSLEKEKAGVRPKRIDLASAQELEFFSPIDGKPKIWFYRAPNGTLEVFDGPGFHPQRREPLAAATPEIAAIAEKILAAQREAAAARSKAIEEEATRKKQEQNQQVLEAANAQRAREESERIAAERDRRAAEEARRLADKIISPNKTVNENGFTFVLTTIKRSGGNLLIELLVTANQEGLGIKVITQAGRHSGHPNSSIYDKSGNLYNPDRSLLGDKRQGDYPFPTDRGIPTRITLIFDSVPLTAEVTSVFVTYWATWRTGPQSTSGETYRLSFRNL